MNISSVKPPKSTSKRRNQEPEAARTKKLPGVAGRSAPITAAHMRSNRRQTASMARLDEAVCVPGLYLRGGGGRS